jgi:hypothetical protein
LSLPGAVRGVANMAHGAARAVATNAAGARTAAAVLAASVREHGVSEAIASSSGGGGGGRNAGGQCPGHRGHGTSMPLRALGAVGRSGGSTVPLKPM